MQRKIILVIIMCLIIIISLNFLIVKKEKINITKEEKSSSFISMMVENGSGEYEEKTDITFPKENYIFNPETSGCENGGTLSWNKEKQKIEASLITSDKCYAYFDKYDFTKSCLFGYEDNFACKLIKTKDNTLIYHDGKCDYEGEENCDLEAGDLSYRYTGGNDIVNNYVCFGSSDEKCPYDNLYRIIGLFKNDQNLYETKLIKADYATETELGGLNVGARNPNQNFYFGYGTYRGNYEYVPNYHWNNANNMLSTNDWLESSLNKINLNDYFINSYLKNLNNGLWLNMIIDHNWIIEGDVDDNIINKYINEAYKNEITNSVKSTKTKIGLMYVSDYGYAALPIIWNDKKLSEYNDANITNNNWLYLGLDEWVLTPNTNYSNVAYRIWIDGNIITGYVYYSDNGDIYTLAIRPTFYINQKIKFVSGAGTKSNPYRIAE